MNRAGFLAALILLSAVPVWTQQNTGQIVGTVTDASGALVVQANVTATNAETGLVRSTISGDTGGYVMPLLPPGVYSVRVEAKGFATTVQRDVDLRVGQALTVDFRLKPGGASEIVEVSGESPLIETTKSEVGGGVDPVEVREMPILDRNFANLMTLVPGVRPAEGFDPTKTKVGNVSINGNDGRAYDFSVDGGDNKDSVVGGQIQNFTMEGIQEFNVLTNRYSAESGRAVAAVVNVISKSGTNTLHGSLFGLFQNSSLNKTDHFERDTCVAQGISDVSRCKAKLHRYHFGGSIGGAVVKDKFFFFGAYEHKREPGSISVSPQAFSELSLFPLAVPVQNLNASYTDHLLTVKLDHRISDRQNVYYRYGRQRWIQPNDQLGDPFFSDATGSTNNNNQFHDFVIGHQYSISPTKLNAINIHFQDFVNAIPAAAGRSFTLDIAGGGAATNPEVCFKPDPGCGGGPGEPEIGQNVNVPQQTLIRKYQFRDDFTWIHNKHTFKFGGNWIYVAKMGGFFFFGANGYQITFWDDPSVILGSPAIYPQGFATPGALESILFNGGSGSTAQDPYHQLAFYFQDDWKVTPRLTLNLGLRWDSNPNFLVPQLSSDPLHTNRTVALLRDIIAANPSDPVAQDGLQRALQLAGDGQGLRRNTADWKQFQPRVGFAYDPSGFGKLVIRGGYGVARDQIFQNLTLFGVQQTQPTIYQTIIEQRNDSRPGACTVDPVNNPLCGFRFGTDPLPAPAPGINDLAVGATGRMFNARVTDPWAQQASIGGSWQFLPEWAFSADYYHVLGTHEPRVLLANPMIRTICNPAWGGDTADLRCLGNANARLLDYAFSITPDPNNPGSTLGAGRLGEIILYGTNNRSLYDGINFSVRKRLKNRYSLNVNYVASWSRSWGGRPTASYSGSGFRITPESQFLPQEFGPTIFDERHRLVLSGVFELPGGFQASPVFQASSARPYSATAGVDIDGDGRTSANDRICAGSTPSSPGLTPACTMIPVNTVRGIPFVQLDLTAGKTFKFGERAQLQVRWELYNLFNRRNTCNNVQTNVQADFGVAQGYCGGQGFGGGFSDALRSQFGFRFTF
jgi:Carboxypeptidase regulatory-like domain/TonB dependent receptor